MPRTNFVLQRGGSERCRFKVTGAGPAPARAEAAAERGRFGARALGTDGTRAPLSAPGSSNPAELPAKTTTKGCPGGGGGPGVSRPRCRPPPCGDIAPEPRAPGQLGAHRGGDSAALSPVPPHRQRCPHAVTGAREGSAGSAAASAPKLAPGASHRSSSSSFRQHRDTGASPAAAACPCPCPCPRAALPRRQQRPGLTGG